MTPLLDVTGVRSSDFVNWPSSYLESVGELASDTWRKGIVAEVRRLGLTGGRVLDLGAGTGIGATAIKEIGAFHVTALDRSVPMLSLNTSSDVKIVADFKDLAGIDDSFDLVVCGFDSFNYLAPAELSAFYSQLARVLTPTGHFIFDYSSPHFLRSNWASEEFDQELSSGLLRWKIRLEEQARSHIQIGLWRDNRALWTEDHYQFSVDSYEMLAALEPRGLTIDRVRNLNDDTFSPAANTHVYVVNRKSK